MLGAIFTALSGMNAYSNGLQIISNNVANLNSIGYRATSLSFADLSDPSGHFGFLGSSFGSLGGGVRIGSSLIDFGQGQLQQTSADLDLAIQGGGMLVLLTSDGKTLYTRTGHFAVDKDGFISDQATGDRLAVLNSTGQPVAINLNSKQINAPAATTKVTFANNLSSSATTDTVSNITVFDSKGGAHVWTATFTKGTTTGVNTDWDVTVKDSDGNTVGSQTLTFDGSTVDPTTTQLAFTASPAGVDPMNVTFDFSTNVTSFSAGTASTLSTSAVDGNAMGTLTGVTVDANGQIQLTYSNSKTELDGAVALADFQEPQELERIGSALFRDTGTGQVRYLASGVDGMGKVLPKNIKSSNVNLSNEFGNLILVQRGFQACSQVVSVSNDMIQQLFGIRSQ